MAGCCDPRGCDRIFDSRYAKHTAGRYRKKGLDRAAARLVELVTDRGIQQATVLEIGGGVGQIGLELLRRGAAFVTTLELSPGYEEEAAALSADAGFTGRVRRRLIDIAADPHAVEAADIVILHRVVCCYPDYPRLLGAAADQTRRQLVFSFPPRNLATRAYLAALNLVLRLAHSEYRGFAHPPAEMLAVLTEHGLRPTLAHRGAVWQIATATR